MWERISSRLLGVVEYSASEEFGGSLITSELQFLEASEAASYRGRRY